MNIPEEMTVIAISEYGAPEVLKPETRTVNYPAAHEILIQVAAAGVNRPDIMQRRGMYPAPPDASDIPGLEVSGHIVAKGSGVTHFNIGDQVCALVNGGGYATYCIAAADLCLPIPPGLSLQQAAALPETFFTVWSNIFDRGHLIAGETILIHGGTSGIGTTAIQLAKYAGAKVIVTTSSDEKCELCLQLGADNAINYSTQDFVAEIATLTNKTGVDVILDIIGGDYFPRNLKCLTTDGRLLQIAIQQGPKSSINLLPVMLKRLTITGSTLRSRSVQFKADIARNLLENIWPQFSTGKIKPVIYHTFPLNEATRAHTLMETNQHIGKIILVV